MRRNTGWVAWACAGALLLCWGDAARAVVIYDSGGFESPRFTAAGNLQGQDAGQGPWLKDPGTGAAVVQTTNPAGGSQSVQMTRAAAATSDTRWAVTKPIVPTASQGVIDIDVDLRVNQATFSGTPPTNTDFGPAFGLEAYDASTTPASPKLIGSVTMDATTGDVLYQAAGTGLLTETGTILSRGAYHHYKLRVDFNARKYQVFADSTLLRTESFVDNSAVAFTDGPMSTFAATGTSVTTGTGTAFFDNYTLQQIPEPTALASGLGFGGLALLLRRRGRPPVSAA